jgi:ABC-2 type transport system permease protein
MINESQQFSNEILILNKDKGIVTSEGDLNYSLPIVQSIISAEIDTLSIPFELELISDKEKGVEILKNKKADALIIIPENFSEVVQSVIESNQTQKTEIEFVGDPTDMSYMISAIVVEEILDQGVFSLYGIDKPFAIKETMLGRTSDLDEFSMYVPGILILSIIMLMFTASIALITEVENKTILRLKLSRIGSLSLLGGISIVQVFIGLISIFLTLLVAMSLGFEFAGSMFMFLLIALLTCLSIIAFSLIIAGFTKTVNEILIVGNFPLFLFMFFTGAAFPIEGNTIFTFANYDFTVQGLMSPTHAISALKKILILDMGFMDIIPELVLLMILTFIYYAIGLMIFSRRHMRVR